MEYFTKFERNIFESTKLSILISIRIYFAIYFGNLFEKVFLHSVNIRHQPFGMGLQQKRWACQK